MICKHCGQVIEDAAQLPNNRHKISIKLPEKYAMGTLEINGESITVYLAAERAEQLGRAPECCSNLRDLSASKIVRVFEFVEV